MPVMITATSAPYPIITQENTPSSSISRYWFDIAVPRDIDENISMFDLDIYSVDDFTRDCKFKYDTKVSSG